jgi:hypothetical protein
MVYARKYLSDVNQWSGIVKEKKFKVEQLLFHVMEYLGVFG